GRDQGAVAEDNRHDVRERLPELTRDREVPDLDVEDLQPRAERAREAEEHRARERGPRLPPTEDQRREGDEARAVRHFVLETALRLHREPRAAEPGDEAADDH